MRKRLFTLLATLFIGSGNFISAQTTFQKTFGGAGGDYGYSVQQTSDGGFIITGKAVDFLGSSTYYVYLIKLDANGDTLWTKKIGATANDWGKSVQQTTDGGFIIAGGSASGIYLMKTDINGDTLWTKLYGSSAYSVANSIQQTTDGGYIVAGYVYSLVSSSYDIYLIKTDTNGDTLWTKSFGGVNDDEGNCVQQTTDGGYIIAGMTESFGAGDMDVYLIKTDVSGDTLWTKTLGGTSDDLSNSIEQTMDGGYVLSGTTVSFGAGFTDVYLIKTDVNGNFVWAKTYGGTNADRGYSAHQTTDGGFIISGTTFSFGSGNYDFYLIKTNLIGDTLWTKAFGAAGIGSDQSFSVQETSDGGYIICGYTTSFGAGSYDVYIIKTDSFGNSGCYQSNPPTIVTSPLTQEANQLSQIFSPPTILTTPALIFGGSTNVNTLCVTIGVNELIIDNPFYISPNPSTGNFNISFQRTTQKCSIEIVNPLGLIVFSENVLNTSMSEINLRNISNGLYYLNVFDGEKYYCKKIVVVQN